MQTIYLDISNKGIYPCIQAKQGEVGRKFLAIITDSGANYEIPNDAMLSVWYSGNTDEGNYSSVGNRSAFAVDGNKIYVELIAQMLLQPGHGELCLSLNRGGGEFIATWNIPYEVEKVPGYGSSVPTEYYTALTEAGAIAASAASAAKAAAEEAKSAAESFTIDSTLSISGHAADAAVVGEMFGNVFSGSATGITEYPQKSGIYGCTGTNIFQNLTPRSKYGVLIIFSARYAAHFYLSAVGELYWGYSGDTFQEPTTWNSANQVTGGE